MAMLTLKSKFTNLWQLKPSFFLEQEKFDNMERKTYRWLKMITTSCQRLIVVIMLLLCSTVSIQPVQPQYPPINITVTSRIADNRLTWGHHPQNPAGYVANYIICRSTTYGNTVPIATVTAATTAFSDNTAGYSYAQEFLLHSSCHWHRYSFIRTVRTGHEVSAGCQG